jgi:adenosylcobinamide kinase/adenosylcobinamide-phosphate guanylyltransferase
MAMTLLTGGAASGKSRAAALLAARTGLPVTLVATAEPGDEEMAHRIARHRAERPADWTTVEEPVDLLVAVGAAADGDVVIVDCLTLWVSNLLGLGRDEEAILAFADKASRLCGRRSGPTIVVTNEVGSGIVPLNAVARAYRDALGHVNAIFAEAADRVALMVAGRPVVIPDATTSWELS